MYLQMLPGEQTLAKARKTVTLEIWTFQTNEFKEKLHFPGYFSIRCIHVHAIQVSANAAG
jgi:hypothetical protein